jgi:hypothetical protein
MDILSIINIKLYKKIIFLLIFGYFFIIFHSLRGKLEIFLKTPQVRVAVNHTSGRQLIKVGGVLESFKIDLFTPINLKICNLYLQ